MKDDTMIIPFHQPDSISDPLTEIAREGARRMLAEALMSDNDPEERRKTSLTQTPN